MTKEEFGREFKRLVAYHHRRVNTTEAQEYLAALGKLPHGEWAAVVTNAIQTIDRWPLIPTLRAIHIQLFPPVTLVEKEPAVALTDEEYSEFFRMNPAIRTQYTAAAFTEILSYSTKEGLDYVRRELPVTFQRAVNVLAARKWKEAKERKDDAPKK